MALILLQGNFLSTPSASRATVDASPLTTMQKISIHALREEGDGWRAFSSAIQTISIHALREEGDTLTTFSQTLMQRFLSTPSARRATRSAVLAAKGE